MTIRHKLFLGLVGTSLLLAFIGCISRIKNSEIKSSALILSEKIKQEVQAATDMSLALRETQIAIHELLYLESPVSSTASKTLKTQTINKKIKNINQYLAKFEQNILLAQTANRVEIEIYQNNNNILKEKESHQQLKLLNNLKKNFILYKNNINIILNDFRISPLQAHIFFINTLELEDTKKILDLLNQYINDTNQETVFHSNEVIKTIDNTSQIIVVSTFFSLIAAICTGSLISRSILRPIYKLKEAAEQTGQGKFQTKVNIQSGDEFSILANAFNQMMDDLSRTTVAKYYVDQIIDSMTDTLIVINSDATIARVNQAAIKLLGYKENELIGKQISVILTPEFYQLLEAKTLQRKIPIENAEIVYLAKDGSKIPVSFSASVMQDERQQSQGIVFVAHDISERKETDKFNTLLVTAVDYAADAIEITDAQAQYQYVNPAFEKITGYNYSEVMGKTPASLLRSGKHDNVFYKKISQTLAKGQVWSGSYVGKRKDGTLYHQEVTISPVSNAAGIITHHVAVKRDITERKQAEEALRQSQANLSALIENTQDAVWSVDSEYKIITFNANFKQQFLLAYGIELKIGMSIVQCLSPKIGEVWVEYYNCALRGKRFCFEQHYEFFSRAVDVEFSFNPILTEDGKVIGVSAFGRNITERKQAEKRLAKINECFLSFGTDPIENINRLTALFGEILGATYTLYNRLEQGMLCSVGQWQVPVGYNPINKPEGHICYDVIRKGSDVYILADLASTSYAQTDPNVMAYNLNTYVGKAVKCRQVVVGSVCAVYQTNYIPSELDRKVIGIVAAAIEVEEERKATQELLRESQERYALAARAANDGLWDWNLKTNQMYLSSRSKSLIGYEENDQFNSLAEFFKCIHPQEIDGVKAAIAAHLEGLTSHFESEYRALHKDGNYRWILCRGLAVRDANGKPYRLAGSQTDITQRKQAEAQLLHQAFHDGLTGLPNRALFMDRLECAVNRAKRCENYLFAVLFLDLDRFKLINDSLGHTLGDQLLVAIGKRVLSCLRMGDTVARMGGDEFTVLLEDIIDLGDATQIAERIQQTLAVPFNLNGHEVFTTVSIGIAISTIGYDRPEDLLRDADTTMYRAKALGKARCEVFDQTMHDRAMERLQLEIDLRGAIERQELQVYYQPIVSLNSGRVAGFEALLRWQHPTRGFVSPSEFIPIAEETGLIISIGWWVLQQSCWQMRTWSEQFLDKPPLIISVNLSGKQLSQTNLVEKIQQILRDTKLCPESLKLEITESVLVENADAAAAKIEQLKALGIKLSIDDFGTGYSSLSYLHRLPIDTLKIDRSFVNHVDCDPEKIEIIRTIVALAWNLGMDIVAEGVETKKQMFQLQALRCEYAQGYLFSKAVDSQMAERLISSPPEWKEVLQLAAT